MTYTQSIAKTQNNTTGIQIVLKPSIDRNSAISLNNWLSEFNLFPIWIPLNPKKGVTKIIPVLPETQNYPLLLQAICQQLTKQTIIEWEGKNYEVSGVEIDSNDLYDLRLTLTLESPLPKSINRAIHALFFQWIANADSNLAETLHNSDNLPLTISSKMFRSNHLEIRITLLTRQLLFPLLQGLSQDWGSKIAIANIPCLLAKSIELAKTTNYRDLFNLTPENTIAFRFLSPTSFKQNNYIQPFPLPELVFGNLMRRWNVFCPEEFQFPKLVWQSMISSYKLETHTCELKNKVNEIGSVGWVRYRFANPEQARIATILAHFASFAGVGRKTALGMGQTQSRSLN
jgi:CRISPR-associated endoribonuclease Cas6